MKVWPQDVTYNYSIDSQHAYFKGKLIVGSDPRTFEVIERNGYYQHYYAQDKNHVYYGAKPIIGIDPKSFVILTGVIETSVLTRNGEMRATVSTA